MTNYERVKNMSVEGAWIKVKSRTKQLDITKKVKDAVWARDGGSCILCGNREAMPNAHYIPRSHGGLGIEENVVTLCCQCHYDYDHTVRREEIKEEIRDYLKEIYPYWSEDDLYFKKYGLYRL